MKSHEVETTKKFTIVDLFRYQKLTFITIILAYGFVANSMVYYGLNFNVDSLSGNLYLNRKVILIVKKGSILANSVKYLKTPLRYTFW